ncbi:MAG: 30S ribosome-binding factor RbfA [Alphaproteobacteria bacterium]|nr:30S ribosome-binding factor RbfA [Alphaproteobacteria bacterium]
MPKSPSRSAPAPTQRQLRAGEIIRRALIEALAEGHFRDPVLLDASITVSEVRISPDLKHASAFVTPLGDTTEAQTVLAALKRARGFLRSEVAHRVEMRHAPELHFELDRSYEEGARIEALLRSPSVQRDIAPPPPPPKKPARRRKPAASD